MRRAFHALNTIAEATPRLLLVSFPDGFPLHPFDSKFLYLLYTPPSTTL